MRQAHTHAAHSLLLHFLLFLLTFLSFAFCISGEKKIETEERKRRRRQQLRSLRLTRRRAGTRWPRRSWPQWSWPKRRGRRPWSTLGNIKTKRYNKHAIFCARPRANIFCLTYYLQEIKETRKKVEWRQLITRRHAGRELLTTEELSPAKDKSKDVHRKWRRQAATDK